MQKIYIVFIDAVTIDSQLALVACTLIMTKAIKSSWIKRNRHTWVRDNYNNWSHQALVTEFS